MRRCTSIDGELESAHPSFEQLKQLSYEYTNSLEAYHCRHEGDGSPGCAVLPRELSHPCCLRVNLQPVS